MQNQLLYEDLSKSLFKKLNKLSTLCILNYIGKYAIWQLTKQKSNPSINQINSMVHKNPAELQLQKGDYIEGKEKKDFEGVPPR